MIIYTLDEQILVSKYFQIFVGVFDERDWLVCGNEPGPSGGQIIIIVIVQFNWQKDTVKSFL